MDYQEARKLLHPDTTRDAIWKIADKQEAIKKINEACVIACDAIDELQEYKQLGTLEEVRDAVEKQKGKHPYLSGDGYADGKMVYDTYECPNCGEEYEIDLDDYDYCPRCGQHMVRDWSEEE